MEVQYFHKYPEKMMGSGQSSVNSDNKCSMWRSCHPCNWYQQWVQKASNSFLLQVGTVVARYLCPGKNNWKVLPTISDPPETIDSIGAGVSNGVGGKEASQ